MRQAEGVGLVQPGGEVTLGTPESGILPMRRLQKRELGSVQRGRIKDGGLKLKWDSKEKYFHWEGKEVSLGRSKLPGEVVRAPSLEVLKTCLNKALSSLM